MAWAILAAGSPAAIVSDWKVDSAATEELMVELHRRLLAGEGPARALQQAQQALLRDPRFSHPYYWAAFGVLGIGW
jgi:CHAT domain-containing protein